MTRQNNRRGQMEIMGLMIIVILIIIGVLFAIKFVVLKKPPETKESFTRAQLASNLGIALMDATSQNCRGTALKDLMIDCAETPGGSISCGDGSLSCQYLQAAVSNITNRTIDEWRVKYEIKAAVGKQEPIFVFNSRGCNDNIPGSSESFFLPTDVGLLTMKIFICN